MGDAQYINGADRTIPHVDPKYRHTCFPIPVRAFVYA